MRKWKWIAMPDGWSGGYLEKGLSGCAHVIRTADHAWLDARRRRHARNGRFVADRHDGDQRRRYVELRFDRGARIHFAGSILHLYRLESEHSQLQLAQLQLRHRSAEADVL